MKMTDEADDSFKRPTKSKMQLSADTATEKASTERRRSLELNSSFYDKLSALGAGSIAVAVSVGIALLGKSGLPISSVHSHLTWLLWITVLLWISLVCSIGHNSMFVKIARLEAERAKAWSLYLGLMAALAVSSGEVADLLTKDIFGSLKKRIADAAMMEHRIEQSEYRAMCLGRIAVVSFLSAYTLVLICLILLWWLTR